MPEEILHIFSPDNINREVFEQQRKKPEQIIMFSLLSHFLWLNYRRLVPFIPDNEQGPLGELECSYSPGTCSGGQSKMSPRRIWPVYMNGPWHSKKGLECFFLNKNIICSYTSCIRKSFRAINPHALGHNLIDSWSQEGIFSPSTPAV